MNPEQSGNSSQFEELSRSIGSRGLVKEMEEANYSNVSESQMSNIQRSKLNTQVIKVNEGSQLSINEKKELEDLKEKNKSLKQQILVYKFFLKYFLTKYKDDNSNQNLININDNDSINSSLIQSQSQICPNKSESLNPNQIRLNLKRSNSNQLNLNILARPNSQTIISANDKMTKSKIIKGFVNSMLKNNLKNQKEKSKLKTKDIQKNKIDEENRKKEEDKKASPFAIKNFRKKYNIPKNITDAEIKIEIINKIISKNLKYEEVAKYLLEKASQIKK